MYAWKKGKEFEVHSIININGHKVYEVSGPLFFGSTTMFTDKFDPKGDPDLVIINFKDSDVSDMSAIEALNKLQCNYKRYDKKILMRGLSVERIKRIEK